MNTARLATPASSAMRRPSEPSWRWSGVSVRAAPASIPAMRPISVRMPVRTTRSSALPRETVVFMNTRFTCSATGSSSLSSRSEIFSTGADSPVSTDSSTARLAVTTSRPSAGTRSPGSSNTTSPGTSPRASISTTWPLAHPRLRNEHALECIHAVFGPVDLHEADHRVDHQHHRDHDRVLHVPDQRREERRAISTYASSDRNWSRKTRIRERRGVSPARSARTRRSGDGLLGREPTAQLDVQTPRDVLSSRAYQRSPRSSSPDTVIGLSHSLVANGTTPSQRGSAVGSTPAHTHVDQLRSFTVITGQGARCSTVIVVLPTTTRATPCRLCAAITMAGAFRSVARSAMTPAGK